ncbi:efflux transporter outer membrane subunit [Granulicella sp. WH15]|uniref:efflux transporter outer membrane subunit n=1 Tax=Granulicella sp. WH15 TaxID=2602070 RepID=UPI0013675540|nr:efflux transporter outer membrane subunit [Granulicella sp. WH15]QHN03981.1 efflux transporter outer membrane subunit [Granulicella sp. WH15]
MNHSHILSRNAILAIAAATIALQGCQVGPKYIRPTVQAPPAFKETEPQIASDGTVWKTASPQLASSGLKWWEIYQEPELNALEDRLNISNQNIAQAFQNFMAARAQVRQARASYSPTLTTTPSYTRARASAHDTTSAVELSGVNLNSNEFSLPFDVSWEPDVWGRIRSTVREYANAAQVSAADLANEKLSEQANLAVYYFEIRGQDAQIALYRKTIDAYQQSLRLTQVLSRTGIDNEQSVAQAKLNLKTAEASATNLRLARAQYEHAIALLLGEPASAFSIPEKPQTDVPPFIPAGIPTELLQRRPDIAAAERAMSQANALIGVQTAAFYPSFSISGTAGLQSATVGSWFTWPSRFFSIGPSATQTLFDAGARRSVLDQYKAQYDGNVAAYRQTVLTAFQQTEDYLAAQRILAQQEQQQQQAVVEAQRYLDLANVRYRTGVDTFLNVFTAETDLLTNQQTTVNLRTQRFTSSVQLIEALGGGWDDTLLPQESAVAKKKP